jgi:hypothetical protein
MKYERFFEGLKYALCHPIKALAGSERQPKIQDGFAEPAPRFDGLRGPKGFECNTELGSPTTGEERIEAWRCSAIL